MRQISARTRTSKITALELQSRASVVHGGAVLSRVVRRRLPAVLASASLAAGAQRAALSAAAPALGLYAMQFTPVPAAVGGAVLGIAAAGKLALTGRILGISGAFKGLIAGDRSPWRFAFVGGLVVGGVVAAAITPAAFDLLPASFTVVRATLGGVLVGLGASLGNGCTSGHGICGNARLSLRSMAFTAVFMAAGAAAATAAASATALGVAAQSAPLTWPDAEVLNQGGLLLATALLTVMGLARLAQEVLGNSGGAGSSQDGGAAAAVDTEPVQLLTEFSVGTLFAFGLVYTGMVRPTKVVSFLSVTHPAWDPSLAFVMGGALAVTLPAFWWLLRARSRCTPLCGGSFQLPTANAIDARLLLGGLLFGAGWGVTGMCPGPAVVALARPQPQVLAYLAGMLGGMQLERLLSRSK